MSRTAIYKDPGFLSLALSKIVKARLAADGMPSQNAVADAAGIGRGQLSGILNGQKQFKVGELDRVCYVVGWKISELVREAEKATMDRYVDTELTELNLPD